MAVPVANPELLKAQYRSLSRQLPTMYFILLSSTWALAATHVEIAPFWLAVLVPIALTVLCAVCSLYWWNTRDVEPTSEMVLRVTERTNYLATGISLAFTTWALLLFPYGDAYTQSHIALYMAITVITCIFSLMHLRSAAWNVALIVNSAFVIFFMTTGQPTFIAAAINIAFVSVGMLAILSINQNNFESMVNAQTEARREQEEQSRLMRMIDDMPVAVMTVDPEAFKITYANETSKRLIRKIEHLLPISSEDLLGMSIDVFHKNPAHQRRILSSPENLPHSARINLGPEVLDLKVSAVTADDGSYIGPMLTWALVTNEVKAENRIRQLAHYDTLTGLPNRVTFREKLAEALKTPGQVALLYIDLDGFKLVNDTRGHSVGDELLAKVAVRLHSACKETAITVGRLGGDEFAVLMPCETAGSATTFARRIIKSLSVPYVLGKDTSIRIGVSVGIALAPEHGREADVLFTRADLALYEAKSAGKGQANVFCAELETRIQDRAQLEGDLREALEAEDSLFVFYQPIVNAETGEMTAQEALIRWFHPQRGWISPADFIPVAEQSGLIDKLCDFVLKQACHDTARRNDDVRVAVNISGVQLGRGTLAPAVLSALVGSGLSPDRLEIEVTETAILDAETAGMDDLRRLHDMGVRIALDDFGTGYSSLSHVRLLPLDKIKIDGSFVKEAVDRPESAAVVKAVADLGTRLGVTTVAEGVETQAQLDRVREEGCVEIQGYFFGQPAPREQDVEIIEALKTRQMQTGEAAERKTS